MHVYMYMYIHVYSLMCTLHAYQQGLGFVLYVHVHNVHAYQQEDIMIMLSKIFEVNAVL